MDDSVMEKLQKQLSYSLKQSLIGGCFVVAVGAVCIYCLAQIAATARSYVRARQELVQSSGITTAGRNPLLDPANDNVVRMAAAGGGSNDAGADADVDEHARITATIRKQLAAYQTYNKNLDAYFKAQGASEAPDKIDQTILDAANDNW